MDFTALILSHQFVYFTRFKPIYFWFNYQNLIFDFDLSFIFNWNIDSNLSAKWLNLNINIPCYFNHISYLMQPFYFIILIVIVVI